MDTNVILGLIIPFLGTVLGAGMVFFMRKQINPKIEKILLSSDFTKSEIAKILKNYEEEEIVTVLKKIKDKRKNNKVFNNKEEISKLLDIIAKEKELDNLYDSL